MATDALSTRIQRAEAPLDLSVSIDSLKSLYPAAVVKYHMDAFQLQCICDTRHLRTRFAGAESCLENILSSEGFIATNTGSSLNEFESSLRIPIAGRQGDCL